MMSSNVLSRPAQPPVDIASLNLNVPVPSPVPIPGAPVSPAPAGRERDPALVRRVRELEDEVRNLRAENEMQVRERSLPMTRCVSALVCARGWRQKLTRDVFVGAESDDRPL